TEQLRAVAGGHAAHQVDQREGTLTLQQISERLLAVEILLPDQVQDIVLDLQRDAYLPEYVADHVELARSRVAGGQGAERTRALGGVPARLFGDHVDVGGVPRGHASPPDPAELDRLALEGLAAHVDDLGDHGQRAGKSQALDVP